MIVAIAKSAAVRELVFPSKLVGFAVGITVGDSVGDAVGASLGA